MTMSRFPNGDVWWAFTDVGEDIKKPAMSKDELVKRCSSLFPEFVTDFVCASDDFVVTIVADHPVTWKWGQGCVTMVGDATHAQMPALGLGCSTAFADIEELCKQMDRHGGATSKALRWYEFVRKPQAAALQLVSRASYFSALWIGSQK